MYLCKDPKNVRCSCIPNYNKYNGGQSLTYSSLNEYQALHLNIKVIRNLSSKTLSLFLISLCDLKERRRKSISAIDVEFLRLKLCFYKLTRKNHLAIYSTLFRITTSATSRATSERVSESLFAVLKGEKEGKKNVWNERTHYWAIIVDTKEPFLYNLTRGTRDMRFANSFCLLRSGQSTRRLLTMQNYVISLVFHISHVTNYFLFWAIAL